MSPASYRTAPPRTWMLPVRAANGQPSPLRTAARRRGGSRSGGRPAGQRVRLVDQLLRRVDLGLVGGQVAALQGVLGVLEVQQGLGQELGHGARGLAPSST